MQIRFLFLLLWGLCSFAVGGTMPKTAPAPSDSTVDSIVDSTQTGELRAAWITLEGDVDPGMNDYVRRAIAEARAQNPEVIVFEINTFGGRLDAAFDIVDTITAIHDIATVALVRQKAISAGALIALSCNKLYMMPSTTIGDCAPILQSQEGPQILGEKIQSPLRAKFRNLAQRNGYPELLSEAMVTPELEVLELSNADTVLYMESTEFASLTDAEKEAWTSRRTIVRNGELLTLTNEEADSLGFSQATVKGKQELETLLGITSSEDIAISWAEELARLIASFSGILLVIGFGAIYMEFKTPGFGVFGIVGIAALSILFAGQYVSYLHDQLPLVLLLLGIALLFVEIFIIPGTLLFGAGGVILIIAALALTFQSAEIPAFVPEVPADAVWGRALLYILVCAVAALVIPVLGSRYLLPLLPEGMTPIMKADLGTVTAPVPEETLQIKIGDTGVAHTTLRPSGKASFGHITLDVQSRVEFIEAGSSIVVESVEPGKIWVVRA
jgi:membrane-bound serine protease (ClpP class)